MGGYVLVVLAFAFGAASVILLFMGGAKLPGYFAQRKLQNRLLEISQDPDQETQDDTSLLVKVQHGGPLPQIDKILGATTRGTSLGRWIDQSGVKITISGLLIASTALSFVTAIMLWMVVKAAWGFIIGAFIGFAIPFMLVKRRRTKRLHTFEEQFPDGLDLISRALKAGHAFATGLKMVADEMPEPVGPEFRKTFDEQNFGLPMKDALDNLTFRVPILDVRFFATAVMIQRETGGNLAEILENLAHVVRERFKILRQVRVYTAHGRFTGYVLLALPAVLGIALSFINPDHMNLLFHERIGQYLLIGALVMQTIGYIWIKQVIKIEV